MLQIEASLAAIDGSLGDYVRKAGDTMTGDLSINDASLYVSGKVGIGTATAPLYPLHIRKNENDVGLLIQSTTSTIGDTAGILFANTSNDAYIKGGILYERKDSAAQGTLHFALGDGGGAEVVDVNDAKMSITKDGYVGIGVLDPSVALDIWDSGSINQRIRTTNTGGYAALSLISGNITGQSIIWFGDENNDQLAGIRYDNADNKFTVRSNYIDSAYINSFGQVGIGEQDPSVKLHVAGDAYIDSSVGIGMESADYKLSVYGPMFASRTHTTGGNPNFIWSNYAGSAGEITDVISMRNGGASNNTGVRLRQTVANRSNTDLITIISDASAPYYTSDFYIATSYKTSTIANQQEAFRVTGDGSIIISRGDLEMTNYRIKSVHTPTDSSDAVNRWYVDTSLATIGASLGDYVQRTGDTMTGDLTLSDSNLILNDGSILFGDGDTAIYEHTDDVLFFKTGI